jgi:uncharacterized protein (TIGR03435 family)
MNSGHIRLLWGVLVAVTSLFAQNQAQPPERLPTFEVASIKENKSGETRVSQRTLPGGRFTTTNGLLKGYIAAAYLGAQPSPALARVRVVGGPDWVESARYDITAKASTEFQPSADGPPAELLLMVRSLLEDRFKLKAHRETREIPIYELVVARADGRTGPELHQSAIDCEAVEAALRAGTPPEPRQPLDPPPCGAMRGPARIIAGGITMEQFASILTNTRADDERLVFDKTRLTGRFRFHMTFTPGKMPTAAPPPGVPPIDPNGPSFFTALEEQLGLKLVATKGPVEVVVIDSIERPTPD